MGSSGPIAGQYPLGRGNPLTSLKVVEVGQEETSFLNCHQLQFHNPPPFSPSRATAVE